MITYEYGLIVSLFAFAFAFAGLEAYDAWRMMRWERKRKNARAMGTDDN